jgi:hypothetical protein
MENNNLKELIHMITWAQQRYPEVFNHTFWWNLMEELEEKGQQLTLEIAAYKMLPLMYESYVDNENNTLACN